MATVKTQLPGQMIFQHLEQHPLRDSALAHRLSMYAGLAKMQKSPQRPPGDRISILAVAITLGRHTSNARPNAANSTCPNAIRYFIGHVRNAEAPTDKRVVQKYIQACVSYSS